VDVADDPPRLEGFRFGGEASVVESFVPHHVRGMTVERGQRSLQAMRSTLQTYAACSPVGRGAVAACDPPPLMSHRVWLRAGLSKCGMTTSWLRFRRCM
jgi:hypothetical protein